MSEDDLDLSSWKVPAPPDTLVDGILARVEGTGVSAVGAREVPAPAPTRRRWGAVIAAAIGGAALAAAAAFVILRSSSPPANVEPGALIAGAASTVTIAPGTTVIVSAGAALTWRLDSRGELHVTQTGGEITYQHSSGRHLVVHAGTARVDADAARMSVEVPMPVSKSVRVGAISAALATVVVVAVYEGRAALSTTTGQVALDAGAVGVAPEADPPTVVAVAATRRDVPTAPRRFASAAERSATLDALAKARARRELHDGLGSPNTGGGGGGGGSDQDLGGLDPDDVRASVREVLPLMTDCFAQALPATLTAGGELTARLSLTTEPDVGTVITEADLTDGDAALIADAGFTECLHETLMSLELPPMPDGGTAEIDYPFAFSDDGDPDEVPAEPPPVSPKQDKRTPPAAGPDDGGDDGVRILDPFAKRSSAPKTVDQLVTEANDAARSGMYAKAIASAEEALKVEPDNKQALTAAAIAACNLKDTTKVNLYLPKLSSSRRGMVEQICLRNGVATP